MNVGSIILRRITFPGRAGELQRRNAVPSLVAELGDNYRTYHEFLHDELAKIGKPPAVEDYDSVSAYMDAWGVAQEIGRAEVLLRNCKAYRERGRPVDAALEQDGVPLVDEQFRLVAVE